MDNNLTWVNVSDHDKPYEIVLSPHVDTMKTLPHSDNNIRTNTSMLILSETIAKNETVKGIGILANNSIHPFDMPLPREMTFTDDSIVSVVAYSILFLIAAVGNVTVFSTLFKYRHRKSRVNLFIMHLSVADMIITFVMMPMEIGWHLTVSWKAGDIGCRVLMFFRAFGFYLSSFILIAISLDRYFAIAHPLSLIDASRRGKGMLALAWILSAVASAPQSVIFHEENHPFYHWFSQCVTFNFFPSTTHELAYNLFNVIMLYVLPLLVISVAYSLILFEISKKTQESREQTFGKMVSFTRRFDQRQLRRSGMGKIEKARNRTLKMTIVIVMVFVICWTPYFVISAWWWFDKDTAQMIDSKITRGLFIFAVSNSCVNPIVYGMFTTVFRREVRNVSRWILSSFTRCCLQEESTTNEYTSTQNRGTYKINNRYLNSYNKQKDSESQKKVCSSPL